jgi:hypothetical protein
MVMLAVVAAALVAAAPAAADPAPTTLTDGAQSNVVSWGATAILSGVLQTQEGAPRPLDGQVLRVERSASQAGPWTLVTTVTNTFAPYSSGEYAYSWRAEEASWWRMVFPGTTEWAAADGNAVLIRVKPVVGKPTCPRSVAAAKKFTVSGSLKPRFDKGSRTVKIRAYRYVSGTWRLHRAYMATNANSGAFSKYTVRLSIAREGKYRFRATTTATPQFAAARSANSRSLIVE